MATYSYSRLNTFETCPLQYKFRYIDRIKKEALSIEQFLGICIHKTMEKLYRDISMTKLNSLGDLITFFTDYWKKNWKENIQNVKGQYTFDNYRKLGQRCIRDYYKRYVPFDRNKTLALENRVIFSLDNEGVYNMMGYIDRLSQTPNGEYEIHDYKTSATLPTQDKINSDKQLALYQMAVSQRWSGAKNIRLVWHFMAFDKEMTARHNAQEREELKKQTVDLIKTIERRKEFTPRESQLCYWCDYASLCPLKKHLSKVDSLPVNKYLNEEGVVLVNKYAELKAKKDDFVKKTDEEISQIKEAIIKYAEKEEVTVIKGINNKLRVNIKEEIKFPPKNGPARKELDNLIKKSGRWADVSDLNTTSLAKAVKRETWDRWLLDKVAQYQRLETSYQFYLSKITDDERLYESGD